jgi:hypothetical protein
VKRDEPLRRFPFVPKSTRQLRPGDFWALPLWDGSFGCGRVIELPEPGGPGGRTMFLGGPIDWHGSLAPTADEIAGADTLDQGVMHLKAIWETGKAILGNRSLSSDRIEPWTFMDATHPTTAFILRGLKRLRPARPDDFEKWPVIGAWGFLMIKEIAEDHFLRRSTITGRTGAEEFAASRRRGPRRP